MMMYFKKTTLPKMDNTRLMAWFMLVIFNVGIFYPGTVYAGGPGQPEVIGFTPVGISDMVDPFTGDFSYNIPLMDIEGYPINIAYGSNISMDQEASWVGLGWNLNVGSVVRNMRGVPDDFNGDKVVKTTHMRPNRSYDVSGVLELELFGKLLKRKKRQTDGEVEPPSLAMSLGLGYNNYNGYSTNFSISPSFNLLKKADHSPTAGFSLSGSSENGPSFAPSASFESKIGHSEHFNRKLTGNIGASFNSRAGLSEISYVIGMKREVIKETKNSRITSLTSESLKNGTRGSFDLGLASYSPSASNSMRSLGITGSWKFGPDFFGSDMVGTIKFTYSSQWINKDDEILESPSYGYFHLGSGQGDKKAILDFNRDNDGSFTKNTPFLPSAHLTNDIYSVNAQGISGSYRGFRNDIGYVFDPEIKTISSSGSVGVETGFGASAKIGVDLAYNRTSAVTGGWISNENKASDHFIFNSLLSSPTYEDYALQEANERAVNEDPLYGSNLGGTQAVMFPLSGLDISPKLDNKLKGLNVAEISNPAHMRTSRQKRNQMIQFLTHSELSRGFGIDKPHPSLYVDAKGHHIGEVIQTGTDGRRYVFGIAAYNHFQEEVTFATGLQLNGGDGLQPADYFNGLISYATATDAPSQDNRFGLDNYYSSTVTPAYAHSYLLTSVLSDDYIDSDGKQGPSVNDQGSYVKFGYKKVDNYQWRTPIAEKTAFRNEGMKVDPTDDKASFIHGKKDLWYVDTIQTKNYVAVFVTEARADGYGVNGRDGGFNASNPQMRLLRKISLYARAAYNANPSGAVPIQEVHFEYSYELCPGFPGNPGIMGAAAPDEEGTGKLTLKKIYFTYQGSKRMKHSPYKFNYGTGEYNPPYNMKAVDRWGSYKPVGSASIENSITDQLNNADFPYTDQHKTNTDKWVASWALTEILLPSGGSINIEYESDDYAYVQDMQAMRMFPIASVEGGNSDMEDVEILSVSDESNENRKLYFKMDPLHPDIADYVKLEQYMYFRCLTSFTEHVNQSPAKYEYVSGYGKVSTATVVEIGGVKYGEIKLAGTKLMDNGSGIYSPIAKTAIQFGRMHLSRYIYDLPGLSSDPTDTQQGFFDFASSVVGAFSSLGELFQGPNLPIYKKKRGTQILTQKSWIRLNDPTGAKLGGGSRVKKILMKDNWNAMSGMDSYEYGQVFTYKTAEGISSGVATYEPQVGGDENPWREPVEYKNELRWAPDENLNIESPLMESMFPSPSVGYSRVVIQDLPRAGVTRTATGKVVKEFYTAKDFPTHVRATDIAPKITNSFLPLLPKYQFVTASQGFAIELNDMHGKPKKESVYGENKTYPLSTVQYFYKQKAGVSELENSASVIYPDGTTGTAELGVKYEAVADFRQSSTTSAGGTLETNLNTSFIGPFPMLVPTAWPSIDVSRNKFRSASFTKVVNRFGILEKTVANQDGSVVETNNLAYDSETGEVLLTQTTTNFNDQVYSMNYPAYWKYDQLGGAWKNIGIELTHVAFNTAGYTAVPDAATYFTEGDELAIYNDFFVDPVKGWVSTVSSSGINVINHAGNPVTLNDVTVKIIRSGRKNKQGVSMASITALENPMNALRDNKYSKVLNAGAIEFGQDWKTYCNCFTTGNTVTGNPFQLGTKGNWRPVKSYTYLAGRTQSNYNKNTNIRQDGVFTAYSPYYKNEGGRWKEHGLNWTYVSEVTAFSPNGMTLETKDALNRYSASTFGFNNTLTTAVGANTKLNQMAFASFEDAGAANCTEHFQVGSKLDLTENDAHTGRTSIRVNAANPVVFTTEKPVCEVLTCADFKIEKTGELVNGTAPYAFEFDVITGFADAGITNNAVWISSNSEFYSVQVTITDAKGCKAIKLFTGTNVN